MKVTILGSGTSTGVPSIGCNCRVCVSDNPKNQRSRASILVTTADKNILIDTSPDLRNQALRNKITRIDAVLFTHAHADHIHGIDDLRSFNYLQGKNIPCYGSRDTIERIKRMFEYIFSGSETDWNRPQLILKEINSCIRLFDLEITPIEIFHGKAPILGYRLGNMAYLTDCSNIPEKSKSLLEELDLLILGALRFSPHPTHFSIGEALVSIRDVKPKRAVLTHMTHEIDHDAVNAILPEGVELGYDGMVIYLRQRFFLDKT